MTGEGSGDAAIAEALQRLSLVDAVAAQDARVALDWLIGEEGLERLSQLALQQFCWYELPFKWLVEPQVRTEIVESLARFLDLAGLERYAARCRSPQTAAVLAAWADDPAAGFRAFRTATDESGVDPPAIGDAGDGWVWSSAMGVEEHEAFWSTATALELAVESGALVPGRPGWRDEQRRLAEDHLRRPRPERLGESLLQAATAARLVAWASGPPDRAAGARSQLVAPLVNALLVPVEVPRAAARSLAPLRWLLDRVGPDGSTVLTARGNLPRAVVQDAVEAFPAWWHRAERPQRDAEVPPLVAIWHLARRLHLVRRTGRRVVVTRRGAALRDDPAALWTAVAAVLGSGDDFEAAVSELVWAVLLQEPLVPERDLRAELAVALTESGWHHGPTGSPVSASALALAIDEVVVAAAALGLVRRRGRTRSPQLRLTATGRVMGLTLLRARALTPAA